ncbi:hypothetical protein BRD17_06690 [Halobacteriales archaeon SW_7_68_16]|nr:MAG: hypothetical protein BRD17_06690 [Halobacteriales archaeon SW_7_68_16]
MSTRSGDGGGVIGAIRVDLRRLHETWMELAFPRQRLPDGAAIAKWRPTDGGERVAYRLWSALGRLAVVLLYPLLLVGFVTRFYARHVAGAVGRAGIVGVVLASLLAWGSLTVIARYRFSPEGFVAVGAAAVVATVAGVLAVVFARAGGRGTTILFAYPFGVTALFLPPVVAALYSPTLADVVFPNSQSLAVWLLDNVLAVGGVDRWLRQSFELEDTAYVAMWFGLAVPVGWVLGTTVALADAVRPRSG